MFFPLSKSIDGLNEFSSNRNNENLTIPFTLGNIKSMIHNYFQTTNKPIDAEKIETITSKIFDQVIVHLQDDISQEEQNIIDKDSVNYKMLKFCKNLLEILKVLLKISFTLLFMLIALQLTHKTIHETQHNKFFHPNNKTLYDLFGDYIKNHIETIKLNNITDIESYFDKF